MSDGIFGPQSNAGSRVPLGSPSPSSAGPLPTLVDGMAKNAWRKRLKEKAGIQVLATWITLPSNFADPENVPALDEQLRVQVIRMPLFMLLEQGRIPDAVTPMINEFIQMLEEKNPESGRDRVMTEFEERPEETYDKWFKMLQAVWLATVVSPTFVEKEEDENIELDIFWIGSQDDPRVDYYDMLYVYQFAQGVDQSVQEFLQFQRDAMGIVAAGAGVQGAPQSALIIDRSGRRMARLSDQPGGVEVGELYRAPAGGNGRASDEEAAVEATDGDRAEI